MPREAAGSAARGLCNLRGRFAIQPTTPLRSLTMQSRLIAGLCAAFITAGLTGPRPDQPLNVRLGYPADSKLLIINADDLAMSHSENDASLTALNDKVVTAATVMVPCPWFGEVAAYAKTHPDADLGLHLTLTAEWQTFRWGPVAPRALVPSLVGPEDRKSTRLNSSHSQISYAVFCLKKKNIYSARCVD